MFYDLVMQFRTCIPFTDIRELYKDHFMDEWFFIIMIDLSFVNFFFVETSRMISGI